MSRQCGSHKKKEDERHECNIAINIPVSYGEATAYLIKRDNSICHAQRKAPLSRKINVHGFQKGKPIDSSQFFQLNRIYDFGDNILYCFCKNLPECKLARRYKNSKLNSKSNSRRLEKYFQKNKPTDLGKTFKRYDTMDWNEDIQREIQRRANKAEQTSFIELPSGLETDAKNFKKYKNYDRFVLTSEKRNQDSTRSTPLLVKSKVNYQENNRGIERPPYTLYKMGKKVTSNQEEQYQPSFIKKSPKKGIMIEKQKPGKEDSVQSALTTTTSEKGSAKVKDISKQQIDAVKTKVDKEKPEPKPFQKINIPPNLLNPIILTFGGKNRLQPFSQSTHIGKLIYGYDPLTNKWENYGNMPVSRSFHTTVVVDNEIYIIGGYDHYRSKSSEMIASDGVVSYNVNTHKWYRRSSLIIPRAFHNSVVYKGVIYTLGGEGRDFNALKSVEKYDPSNKKWIKVQEMVYPTKGAAACVTGEHIFVIGGQTLKTDNNNTEFLSSIIYYEPENDRWFAFKFPLPYPIAFGNCTSTNNIIWLVGGRTIRNAELSSGSILTFDLLNPKWNEFDQHSMPRMFHACVSIETYVFVIGGLSIVKNHSMDITEGLEGFKKPSKILLEPLPFSLEGLTAIVLEPINNRTYSHSKLNTLIKQAFLLELIRQRDAK